MTKAAQSVPALGLNGVSYRTTSRKGLVSDVNLSVQPGQIVVIAGPNGAGKTTLVRMIAGLMKPSEGRILLAGACLASMRHAVRARQIAYVGQSEEPDGRLTVNQYVALGLLPRSGGLERDAPSRARDDALLAVGLRTLADRRLDSLSGGERQKAKIARAICQNPTLLVLDEPTNHLDARARGELLSLVAAMGITVVAALHDLTLIEAFADRVAVLDGGQLTAFGPPAETLSPQRVRSVFGVDMHRLPHPHRNQKLPTLDIQISKPDNTTQPERKTP